MAQNSRLQELLSLEKANKLSPEEKAELLTLLKNRKSNHRSRRSKDSRSYSRKPANDFGPGNDFSWWNKYPELVADCTNFKCNVVAGKPLAGADLPYIVPGVLSIKLTSVYGSDSAATDPINVWARDLYLKMFQKYRPVTGYSASDLGIAIIAGIEILKLIASYERIYGIINRYSVLNVNMPDAEAAALGITASTAQQLRGSLSDFRYDLNSLLMKAQRLCIPKDISAIADGIALFAYEYIDHESPRGQFIVFTQRFCGLYSDVQLQSGGSVEMDPILYFDFTRDNMCAALEDRLNALLGSDSIQRIYADLVVWFGESAMMQFLPVPENYVVMPVYSEEILHKLHNLEFGCDPNSIAIVSAIDPSLPASDQTALKLPTAPYTIYQVNDRIVTKFGFASGAGTRNAITVDGFDYYGSTATPSVAIEGAHPLDTYRNDITPDIIMEGALFKYASRQATDGTSYVRVVDSAAFYIVNQVVMITMTGAGPVAANLYTMDTNVSNIQATAGQLAVIDWAPLSYALDSTYRVVFIGGDVDNVVPLYSNDLEKIHRCAVLSGLKTDQPIVNK